MYSKVISFFSTKSVTEKIINHTLSEGQLFLYFYLIMVFDAFNFSQGWLSIAAQKLTNLDLVYIWGYFLFTIVGLIALFISNEGIKGKNFISKFFSFSVTVGFKYEIAMEIITRLPGYIPILKIPYYGLISWWTMNILMVANIAYRIRATRNDNKIFFEDIKTDLLTAI